MLLINCKVELRFRWTKSCILALAGVENDCANSNNNISTVQNTKLYVSVITLSGKDNQKLSELLS